MEWEILGDKYTGSRVADIIRSNVVENTQAVIVLLGKQLKDPPTKTPQFTHNWVNFEVGVSAGCKKPVWVFEKIGELIQFPIPYVTDYVRYELEKVEHLREIGAIMKDTITYSKNVKPPHRVKCPYENCNAEYNYWDERRNELNCPVCRQAIKLN